MKTKLLSIIILGTISFLALANNTQLLVVTTENRSFQYQEHGENKGPSIDILVKILKESGLTADIKFFPWARTYQTALTRPNTLILGLIRTEEREDKFHWIQELAKVERVYIALKDKPENYVENDHQAKGKRIAVLRESYAHNELLKKGFVEGENLYVVSTLASMFNLFINGKVDLVFADPKVVSEYSKLNSPKNRMLYYKQPSEKIGYLAASLATNPQYLKQLHSAALKLNLN